MLSLFPIATKTDKYMNKNLPEIKHLPQTEEFVNLNDLTCWRGNIDKGNKNMQMMMTRPFSARTCVLVWRGSFTLVRIFFTIYINIYTSVERVNRHPQRGNMTQLVTSAKKP